MVKQSRKKVYERPTLSLLEVRVSSPVLVGSVTPEPVEVSSVSIEPYQNGGTFEIEFWD